MSSELLQQLNADFMRIADTVRRSLVLIQVGINTMMASTEVGLAIPLQRVKAFLHQVLGACHLAGHTPGAQPLKKLQATANNITPMAVLHRRCLRVRVRSIR